MQRHAHISKAAYDKPVPFKRLLALILTPDPAAALRTRACIPTPASAVSKGNGARARAPMRPAAVQHTTATTATATATVSHCAASCVASKVHVHWGGEQVWAACARVGLLVLKPLSLHAPLLLQGTAQVLLQQPAQLVVGEGRNAHAQRTPAHAPELHALSHNARICRTHKICAAQGHEGRL